MALIELALIRVRRERYEKLLYIMLKASVVRNIDREGKYGMKLIVQQRC